MTYIASFAISLGPVFWLLIEALGRSGAFWFYGAIGVVTLWFCWKFVPETKGKPLEEIEELFEGRAGVKAAAAPGPVEPVG
jgi:SP family xylose:H+ symportor-like MFS transporter